MRATLFQMAPLKALGIYGVQAFFFQKHWSVIGVSIYRIVRNIFNRGMIDETICLTLIVLIPKQDKLEGFNHFRPISLCNTIYKIITKVIANQFKLIMDKLVTPMQSSFVPGRHITNNIIVTQEAVHSMKRMKGKDGYMAVKIDLEKAYDRLIGISFFILYKTLAFLLEYL